MNISSRCEYACRAVVELGRRETSEEPITAASIAESRGIPEKYLVHILLQLKRAGVVRSVRGAQGGYFLARAPEEISLADIITAIDGPVLESLPLEDHKGDDLALTWKEVAQQVGTVLENVTIRHILERAAKANMYYI